MEEDGVPDWVLSGLGSENSGNLAALGEEPTTEPDVPKQIFVQAGQFGESGFAETNATLALILSLVGLLMCGPVTAIPALIIAQRALAVTSKIPGHPDHDPAVASKWISIVTLALWLVMLVLLGGFFLALINAGL